jgi:hypothetical protein
VLSIEMRDLLVAARALPGYADGFVGVLHNATGLLGRRVAAPADELVASSAPALSSGEATTPMGRSRPPSGSWTRRQTRDSRSSEVVTCPGSTSRDGAPNS